MRPSFLLLFTAGLAAACSPNARPGQPHGDGVPEQLAGRVAGEPVDCIDPLPQDEGPIVIDEHTILYRDGTRYWKTGPRGACPALRPLNTLIVERYGSQLCRNDRFRVLEPGNIIPSQYCFFSKFTPYDRPGSTRR